jgi:hypothetical protein
MSNLYAALGRRAPSRIIVKNGGVVRLGRDVSSSAFGSVPQKYLQSTTTAAACSSCRPMQSVGGSTAGSGGTGRRSQRTRHGRRARPPLLPIPPSATTSTCSSPSASTRSSDATTRVCLSSPASEAPPRRRAPRCPRVLSLTLHSTRRHGSRLTRIREGERIRGDACADFGGSDAETGGEATVPTQSEVFKCAAGWEPAGDILRVFP